MSRRYFIQALFGALASGVATRAFATAKPFTPATTPPGKLIRLQTSSLAGFQYHAAESVWPQLREHETVILLRERDNPSDHNAVSIEWQGHKLGYLPRTDNVTLAQMLDRGQNLRASIDRLRISSNPWKRMDIGIFLMT